MTQEKRETMKKQLAAIAAAGLLVLPHAAAAGAGTTDRIGELEKQMAEMARTFNAQMQAMQGEIAQLKSQNSALQQEITRSEPTAGTDKAPVAAAE